MHRDIMEEIRTVLEEHDFASVAEAHAFIDDYMRRRNSMPVAQFQGLSPELMMRLLSQPFNSPDLVDFPKSLSSEPTAPILRVCSLLYEAIGETGVKATVTGNLPVKMVREIAQACLSEEEYTAATRFGEIRTEPEFHALHIARIVLTCAGIIKKQHGKFTLTAKARKLSAKSGYAEVYPMLLRAYAEKFNWDYLFRLRPFVDVEFVQRSFAYSLLLLHRSADGPIDCKSIVSQYFEAFPMAIDMIEAPTYMDPIKGAHRDYVKLFFTDFAEFLGLIEVEHDAASISAEPKSVRKLPLLDEAVVFHI